MAYHARIEAFSKDIQHRPVFTQNLSDEMCDSTLLGDNRQALDENGAQAATVEVVSDLDRDFRAGLSELDVGGVPYEHAGLVVRDQPIVLHVGGRREMRSEPDVRCSSEEPKASRLQAQPLKE
jgi:hypothetical protein